MDHASTPAVVRHRESKAYRQRLAYWLKKDLSMDEAMRRADLKELINQPLSLRQDENLLRRKPALISNLPPSTLSDENLLERKPARTKTCSDENLLGRKPAAKLEPLKNLTNEIPLDLAQEVLAEGNGSKPGVVLNFPSFRSTSANFSRPSTQRDEVSLMYMPNTNPMPSSISAPPISMIFKQPLSWNHSLQSSQDPIQASPWMEFGRKLFWLLFAMACLAFLVWGNFIRMEGPLPEVLFKAFFGEILVFGAGLMSFKSMLDQTQKVLTSLAGIGISLFLTQTTISAAHVDASAKRQIAQQNLMSESVARDSIAKNLSEIAPDRIKRAEEIRSQLAVANERVTQAEIHLNTMPLADINSHSADLLIRLLAQLSIVLAVSQIRQPTGEAGMRRAF